jgi:hypothetical protein
LVFLASFEHLVAQVNQDTDAHKSQEKCKQGDELKDPIEEVEPSRLNLSIVPFVFEV